MRALLPVCLTVIVAACEGGAPRPAADADSTAAAPSLVLEDLAGQWVVAAFRTGSDISYVTYTMTATADTAGWTVTFPGRPPMAVAMRAGTADSFVVELGPYPSVVRPNVQVRAITTGRMIGDRLEGRFDARYANGGTDTVVTGRFEAARVR